MLARLFAPTLDVSAHCDLPCGVYDPAQARIEAESVKAVIQKAADSDDPDFHTRAVLTSLPPGIRGSPQSRHPLSLKEIRLTLPFVPRLQNRYFFKTLFPEE